MITVTRFTGARCEVVERILSRAVDADAGLIARVQAVVDAVRRRGDAAVRDYTLDFDGVELGELRADMEAVREAAATVDGALQDALREAIANVRAFHERQRERSWSFDAGDGVVLGQRVTPLDSAGLYIPGGRAAYPSSLIMN